MGFIIYGSLNTLTGGYIYDRLLFQYLQAKGHQVDIVSIPWRNYGCQLLNNFSRKLRCEPATKRYDVLLQDELGHPSFFLANNNLKGKLICPIVAIVHQVLCRQPRSGFLNWIYQAMEKRYLKSVDAFVFNSNTTRKTVEVLVDGIGTPSIVAFPAGDRLGRLRTIDLIESRAHESGPLRLIFVGNILPNKKLAPLINGLSALPPEIWHLTIVGSLTMDHTYVRHVKRLITNKKVRRQVELVGPKDGAELVKYLSQSHVFIMPYSHEGFGMAHLEAMAFALPVVGSTAGAVKEFVTPGQNGFLIETDDFKSVNNRINDWYHDRKSLIQMSHGAFETFSQRPKWKDTMESIHRFLTELVANESSSR